MSEREEGAGVRVNRAPVLTLWAAVVAERLGYDWDEAVTLGRAVAGLNAQSKGQALGMFKPVAGTRAGSERAGREGAGHERAAPQAGKPLAVELLHRMVPAVRTEDGVRALDKGRPTNPASVEKYLESKFGDDLERAIAAMKRLAQSRSPEDLAQEAFALYERFRPAVPKGTRGWGAKGTLDLGVIRSLAGKSRRV